MKRSILLRLLILGVCAYMIVTLVGLWNTLNIDRAKLNELKVEAATKSDNNKEMNAILDEGLKSQLFEKAARERLGFAYPGEQVYKDISGN